MTRQRQSVKETWTIRLPFTLAPGKAISLSKQEHQGQIGQWKCDLSGSGQSYILSVAGFPSEAAAEDFIGQLGTGLMWARVLAQTGIRFDLELEDVTYSKDPHEAARNIFGSTD